MDSASPSSSRVQATVVGRANRHHVYGHDPSPASTSSERSQRRPAHRLRGRPLSWCGHSTTSRRGPSGSVAAPSGGEKSGPDERSLPGESLRETIRGVGSPSPLPSTTQQLVHPTGGLP